MIIATCGHDVSNEEEYGTLIALADYSRDGSRVVGYPCVCEKCLIKYKGSEYYLPTEEDEELWLNDGIIKHFPSVNTSTDELKNNLHLP